MIKYSEMLSGDVVAEVNGTQLVKAKLERDVKFRLALEAQRNPKLTVSAAKQMEQGLYAQSISYFLMKCAYAEEAKARHIHANAEDLETARTRFLNRYTRRKGSKWNAFVKSFDRSLTQGLDEDLSFEALRIRVDAELKKLPVKGMTPVELDQLYTARTNYFVRQSATNALIYANATNLWRKIVATVANAKFTEIGKDLAAKNEHILFDESYGPQNAESLRESPELVKMLPMMKLNGITPPVENDNGLAILKLQTIDNSAAFGTTPRQPSYVFSRIFFELPEIEEQMSKEELGNRIERQRRDELPASIIDARMKRLRVVYPNGKVIFNR